ncbi:ABC transporter substrate-binding protein [Thiothrix nivea]|uniref:Amino acid/amide ABC transporter substrate-binding protein, HAAT family n=1 Tax=Thiothrix nivea (strain ATCC 35100 / DSM 5205 / JP2) TaxID=870187 RepID=A0A656HKH3_THINJ|nr:ABC transporter substrate-binding protein [Thiothrix nivea]EIJ36016.1 amino acid/amide ABC transporter substrate-binding protein, HAAT family [Thiothrix nivea DSM 5205]
MKNYNRYRLLAVGLFALLCTATSYAEDGVTSSEIIIGGVMDLEGRSSGLGQGMKAGIEAALQNQTVAGRKLRFQVLNDSYTPEKALDATQKLAADKVFLFAGNVGTPTAAAVLPLLAEQKIPAVGFFTGAGLLRPGQGDIINFRASYVQETKAVIDAALKHGINPTEVCAYVQNDAYGMAGVSGIREALKNHDDMANTLTLLDKIIEANEAEPARNNIGPVGTYTRNTFIARDGYDSLKAWEQRSGVACKLVVTVGTYEAIARFIAYASSKAEPWIFSAVSFTGADDFQKVLNKFNIHDQVIMTQVVPLSDSDLPIVQEARSALGKNYGYVSQEGYIVGKLIVHGLQQLETTEQDITRRNLLATFKGQQFNLDGLNMDFSKDNQGSDLVVLTSLSDTKWQAMQDSSWQRWLNPKQKTTD